MKTILRAEKVEIDVQKEDVLVTLKAYVDGEWKTQRHIIDSVHCLQSLLAAVWESPLVDPDGGYAELEAERRAQINQGTEHEKDSRVQVETGLTDTEICDFGDPY